METVHLYVVPENQLPPKPDYVGMLIATLCSLVCVGMVGLMLFAPKSDPTIAFTTTIAGFRLPAVSKTVTLTIQATGKGHTNATYAHGAITFYNGQTYTQIVPVGTIVKGADGVSVITDAQAVIPPAAQTIPPTYGQVQVPAHALQAGQGGNIQAGNINEPCCVTSVIVQNPYNFTDGKDARDFSYLTTHDVLRAVSSLSSLKLYTLSLFSSPVLEPTCKTGVKTSPAVGQETAQASVVVTEICYAFSYDPFSVQQQIATYSRQFGSGALTQVVFHVVGISHQNNVVTLRLYITAQWHPIFRSRFQKLIWLR